MALQDFSNAFIPRMPKASFGQALDEKNQPEIMHNGLCLNFVRYKSDRSSVNSARLYLQEVMKYSKKWDKVLVCERDVRC